MCAGLHLKPQESWLLSLDVLVGTVWQQNAAQLRGGGVGGLGRWPDFQGSFP